MKKVIIIPRSFIPNVNAPASMRNYEKYLIGVVNIFMEVKMP